MTKKTCFVVGPIGSDDSPERVHADWLLEMIVEPALASVDNYHVSRADRITTPGQIDAQVIRHLLDDDLVIADLSLLNPNAFYEIGIRHMAQKPIIHMQLVDERIPFDVSIYRSIKFSRVRPSDIRSAIERLTEQIEAINSPNYEVENPITLARGRLQFEQRASSDEKIIIGEIRALASRIEYIENINNKEISNKILMEVSSKRVKLPAPAMVEIIFEKKITTKNNIDEFVKEPPSIGYLDEINLKEENAAIYIRPYDDTQINTVMNVAKNYFGEKVKVRIFPLNIP